MDIFPQSSKLLYNYIHFSLIINSIQIPINLIPMSDQSLEIIPPKHSTNPVAKIAQFIKTHNTIKSPAQFHSKLQWFKMNNHIRLNIKAYIEYLTSQIVGMLVSKQQGHMLATIVLLQFCSTTKDSYWDILFFLSQQKSELTNNDEDFSVFSQKIMKASFASNIENLQYKYGCSCINSKGKIMERCLQCLQLFHPWCQDQLLICNKCLAKNSSVESRTIELLFCGYINLEENIVICKFRCPNVTSAKQQKSDSFDVRLRIILNRQMVKSGFSFGHIFSMYINEQTIGKVKMEGYRHVIEIKIRNRFLQQTNTLILKNEIQRKPIPLYAKQSMKSPIIVCLVKVVPQQCRKTKSPSNFLKLQLKQLFLFYSQINKDYYKSCEKKITLTSKISQKPLKVPLRGFYCRHFECFDFDEIKIQKKMKLCPLCATEITGLYIDTIYEQQLHRNKNQNPCLTMIFSKESMDIMYIEEMNEVVID